MNAERFDAATMEVLNAPYGSTVRYQCREESGTGTLSLVWYGVCEVADVVRHDGSKLHVYPELGETLQLLDSSRSVVAS